MLTQHYPLLCPQGRAIAGRTAIPMLLWSCRTANHEAACLLASCTPNPGEWGRAAAALVVVSLPVLLPMEVAARQLYFFVRLPLVMVGSDLTLQQGEIWMPLCTFPPTLNRSHQLKVRDIIRKVVQELGFCRGKAHLPSPFSSPKVLTCSLCTSSSFWMKQTIWSKVGLCVGSRLQHACMMLYLQSQTRTGWLHCAAAKLLEGLQPQALPCSTLYFRYKY